MPTLNANMEMRKTGLKKIPAVAGVLDEIFSVPHGWCAMFLFVPEEITAGRKRGGKTER